MAVIQLFVQEKNKDSANCVIFEDSYNYKIILLRTDPYSYHICRLESDIV